MKDENLKFETKLRKSIHSDLKNYCPLTKDDSFMEVTEWTTEEGFDVYISGLEHERISMTWGQFRLLKKLVKKIQYD